MTTLPWKESRDSRLWQRPSVLQQGYGQRMTQTVEEVCTVDNVHLRGLLQ